MVIRLVGTARLVDGAFDVRVSPALVDKQHPLAKVDGAFNAVMLQGDAIREITLEGPGAGGTETASAVIADMASVIGTMKTGFLQNDAAWRVLPRLDEGESSSPFYFQAFGRGSSGRAGPRRRGAGASRDLDRAAAPARKRRRRRTARRHPPGTLRVAHRGARRARRAARGAPLLGAVAGRLGARRRGAGMGVRYRVSQLAPRCLGEGSTPLVLASRLSAELGAELHVKYEGLNPTGSFKDRGMVVAVSRAVDAGRAQSSARRPATRPRRLRRTPPARVSRRSS